MTETMSEIFRRSPEEALEEKFRREEARLYPGVGIFCYQSVMGNHAEHRYGSYKRLYRRDLEGRKYEIEYMDSDICIFWTDVLHDPKTYRNVPK